MSVWARSNLFRFVSESFSGISGESPFSPVSVKKIFASVPAPSLSPKIRVISRSASYVTENPL